MRTITTIIIHCSATHPNWMAGKRTSEKVAEIRRWHVEDRGWADIGYNYVIDRDGTVAIGRDRDHDGDTFEEIGAHTKGHNSKSLGICLIGGHGSSATDAFESNFTEKQEAALRGLIARIEDQLGDLAIAGHNDFAAKACPGFKVDRWLKGAPPARSSLMQSDMLKASAAIKVAQVGTPLVGMIAGIPWQTILVLCIFSAIALAASGIIDIERIRKWRQGDR
ncbi:N-acetylmuramoyl-L-alanine amidase [Pseudosulfitobacter sp. DSM 107133]|uniref:N-acetylmuramoyl-L-alanine amidase n=1 Tax=Pseudosulfitobacter sp. DSM 107133 TaxID=2883100 RepID=UPI000DF35215|nr:N-acetylmuramoyl-L-alanine amidase [Pseudosulfitobacter sp. DSM 107133]UOA25918.1 hypothetical protein DSM107133_00607 [Pseudosulfitobacter sp. DSM 107133]